MRKRVCMFAFVVVVGALAFFAGVFQPAQVLVSGSAEGRMHDFIGRRCGFILGELRLFGERVL